MSNAEKISPGALAKSDIELIERIVYRCGDDVAVSISRSFERLEERIDAAESRLYSRLEELSDEIARTSNLVSSIAVNPQRP